MKHNCLAISLAATFALGAIWGLKAEEAVTPPGAAPSILQPDSSPSDLLGAPFENQSAGIALRLPAGCHRVRSGGPGDDLGQFADEKRNWQVKLARLVRQQPTRLANATDNNGQPIVGLLDQTVGRLKQEMPGCTILRSDLTNVQDGDPKLKDNVAMIAVRYSAAGGHYLSQQAIIQSTDRLFFLLTLTTPGSKLTADAANNDPAERAPVETFRQMLDSVRLLDTSKIVKDQVDRLVRTRALMVNFTAARINSVLIPQQWIRIIRDGKDIGYSYITEEASKGVPRPLRLDEVKLGKTYKDALPKEGSDGILIGVRARSSDPKFD
ncbi:MAG TPA: hypothetical protein VLJ39_00200, partial [Tepidisphaeraceae bacterium]|nr:hypothetical protein [Tepidisphaeraceae bacterium]